MNRLTKERINKRKSLKAVFGILIIVIASISVIGIIDSANTYGYKNIYVNILPVVIFNLPFVIIYIILAKSKIKFNQNEKDIFIIILVFLKELKDSEKEILFYLEDLFSEHPKEEFDKLFSNYKEDINILSSCKNLSIQKPEIRYYALYSLFDLASRDRIYSLAEEEFIEEVRKLLRIHSDTFQYIKNIYINQGLKEERKIIEEQYKKRISKPDTAKNVFEILGISPEISKRELKKVYRILAKKYHPDKYHGQNEEIIQQAEEKFQEILEAYELVKKHFDITS